LRCQVIDRNPVRLAESRALRQPFGPGRPLVGVGAAEVEVAERRSRLVPRPLTEEVHRAVDRNAVDPGPKS
jgi:hypothetical protein